MSPSPSDQAIPFAHCRTRGELPIGSRNFRTLSARATIARTSAATAEQSTSTTAVTTDRAAAVPGLIAAAIAATRSMHAAIEKRTSIAFRFFAATVPGLIAATIAARDPQRPLNSPPRPQPSPRPSSHNFRFDRRTYCTIRFRFADHRRFHNGRVPRHNFRCRNCHSPFGSMSQPNTHHSRQRRIVACNSNRTGRRSQLAKRPKGLTISCLSSLYQDWAGPFPLP